MLTPLVYLAILPLVTGWCSVNEIARAVGAHGKLIPACPTNAHIRKVIRIVEPLVVDAADDEKSFTFPNFVEGLFLGNIPIRTYGADWLHWYGEGFRFRFVRFGRCSLPFDAWGRNHHIDAWRWLIRNQGAQRIAIWPRTMFVAFGIKRRGLPVVNCEDMACRRHHRGGGPAEIGRDDAYLGRNSRAVFFYNPNAISDYDGTVDHRLLFNTFGKRHILFMSLIRVLDYIDHRDQQDCCCRPREEGIDHGYPIGFWFGLFAGWICLSAGFWHLRYSPDAPRLTIGVCFLLVGAALTVVVASL